MESRSCSSLFTGAAPSQLSQCLCASTFLVCPAGLCLVGNSGCHHSLAGLALKCKFLLWG
eukprot:jgi/Mesvir1/12599/Mv25718-RA.1